MLIMSFFTVDGGHVHPDLKYGKAVFGIVEKADVKTIQSPRRVSVGSSGEDGAQCLSV